MSTNRISRGFVILNNWIQGRFRCKECKVLRSQVSSLQGEILDWQQEYHKSDEERKELQDRLLNLLDPIKSPKADQKPTGGIRTWRSFSKDYRKTQSDRLVIRQDIPDISTPHEPIEDAS